MSGLNRVLAVIVSLLLIVAGLYLLFNMRSIVWIFSAAVAIHGVMLVIRYAYEKDSRNGWDIISGIINILFGGVMLFGGASTRVLGIMTIEMFIAFWALFLGISQIFGSFKLKKIGVKKWGWTLVCGILMIVCGIVFIAMPLAGSIMLVGLAAIYAGIGFIIIGITGLAAALSSAPKTE